MISRNFEKLHILDIYKYCKRHAQDEVLNGEKEKLLNGIAPQYTHNFVHFRKHSVDLITVLHLHYIVDKLS